MKHYITKTICWAVIALLAIGVITDALCEFGLNRGWQYLYNAAFFIIALPGLLVGALSKKTTIK